MNIKWLILTLVPFIVETQAQAQQNKPPEKKSANGASANDRSVLSGILSAPSGTSFVLKNNGKSDLPIVARNESGKNYSSNTFKFQTSIPDSIAYKLTITTASKGLITGIYAAAEGKTPQKENAVRIGCDFNYDLVSRSSNDAAFSTFYESIDPSVGGGAGEEGRYIVFVSSAAGLAGSTGKHRQIFWRDRNAGVTKLISASPSGEEGAGDSFAPALSVDGKSVAFESYSANLVQADGNGLRDIFLWNATTNKIVRVSKGENGKEPNAESYEPAISGNGNFVSFTSTASNISITDKGTSNNNVFLYDVLQGSTKMISVDPISRKGGGGSNSSLSYDGTRLAFYSHTATLTPGDNNGFWDIFLYDKNEPALKRISLTSTGGERNQGNESANRVIWPSISGNGRYITFTTTASNMVPGDTNNFQDVFVYDVHTGTTVIASCSATEKSGNADSPIGQGEKIAINYDGTWVAFTTNTTNLGVPATNVVMHNMTTNENKIVTTVRGSSVARPSISYSGSYVVFGMGAKLDNRFGSSGIFASYTGLGPSRFCPQ